MLHFIEQFLDTKCYEDYIPLFLKDNNLTSPEKLFNCYPRFMITWGFTWRNTKEGMDFWREIHRKWNSISK